MKLPRLLIAGLRGGSGKTLVTVGLQAAWRRQGYVVAPFKKGPDYIDAAWSTSAAERACRNLDLFLLDPPTALRAFRTGAESAHLAVIEGNRGLFDGADARGSYSTAELAKLLRTPVVLVVDCTKATRTVAAAVLGCQQLDPAVAIRGVILNHTAGARHEAVVRAAIQEATGLPILGVIPRLTYEILPERHLGLVPPAEHEGRQAAVRQAGEVAERFLDLEALADIARAAPPLELPEGGRAGPVGHLPPASFNAWMGARIGVFRDAAFQFYYPENLEALERAGGQLVEISPLADRELADVDALYIGGGFPETLAAGLADNASFRQAVRQAALAGMPVYAECGGAVFLGEHLSFRGQQYPMAGVLPVAFGFQERPRGHGYTVLETVVENPFFPLGMKLRGHEFHYTYLRSPPAGELRFAFRMQRGHGFGDQRDGLCQGNVLACYTHLHALSVPGWGPSLVRAAAQFRSHSTAGVSIR